MSGTGVYCRAHPPWWMWTFLAGVCFGAGVGAWAIIEAGYLLHQLGCFREWRI